MTNPLVPIRDVVLGFYDGPHATPTLGDSGALYLGIPNISADGRLDFAAARYVADSELPKWTKRVTPQSKDIVFTYEATLHRYGVIPEGLNCCLGRRTALIRVDERKINHRYLFYYFFSPEWRTLVDSNILTGATVDRIPLSKFPDFLVRLPRRRDQERIAEILSAYDDLIENNQRRIKLLEEAARRLYREWFVALRFPGHERVKLVDGVPQGWSLRAMSDVCDAVGGATPTTARADFWDGDITWLTPTDVTRNGCLFLTDSSRKITASALENCSSQLLPAGTIFMTSRASIGYFALLDHAACTNQGFISVVPKAAISREFLLFNLMSRVDEFISRSTGSTFLELSKKTFRAMECVWPPQDVLASYSGQVGPMLKQIEVLKKQLEAARHARDALLPRLMSGALAV